MKIEVEFPADFESNQVGPIHLGRFYLGNWIARHVMCPDGKARLVIPQEAIDAKLVVVTIPDEVVLYGFGAKEG